MLPIYLTILLVVKYTRCVANTKADTLECKGKNARPTPVCSAGFKIVTDQPKQRHSVPVCEKIVYSDVQWRCIRGHVFDESKVKLFCLRQIKAT